MKIATFNVNSLRKRLPLVLDWLQRHKPDVLCLQETKVEDADFPAIDGHSPEKQLKHVGYHEDARNAYQETVSWGLVDVFRRLYPNRVQYTFWDYRKPSSLEANKGWRIDHILATPPLAEHCMECDVDVEPWRDPNASDHTVLWAEFAT